MQGYYGMYNISDWPYWFDVFILSFIVFVIIGIIVYFAYKDQKDNIENLKSQFDSYAVMLHTEQDISNSLRSENSKLRKEIQTLRQNESKEKSKEISW